MSDWHKLQEDVAKLFRSFGCDANVDVQVQGIRASHKIDVWVRFYHFGLRHQWAIECKNWQKPVSKEKVLALKSQIDDIGADRGILISQSGFQSGAWHASKFTNIDLMDFEELKLVTYDDFLKIALESLDHKIKILSGDMSQKLYSEKRVSSSESTFYPNPSFDTKACLNASDELIYLQSSIEWIREGGDFSIIRTTKDGPMLEFYDTFKDFLEEAHIIVHKVEEFWTQQKDKAMKKAA